MKRELSPPEIVLELFGYDSGARSKALLRTVRPQVNAKGGTRGASLKERSMNKRRVMSAGLALVLAGTAFAQAPAGGEKPRGEAQPAATGEKAESKKPAASLKVGDKAPALTIEKWVKGEPVTGFEAGRVYVVEFWATWCGPCIASMPHLSELQKAYKAKGLTVIGVTREDPNNSLEDVQEMVKEKGDVMGYTVAWDSGGATYNAYMKAAKQNGIPTSFVVDQAGTVAWIGHPMWLDLVIEPVLNKTWNAEEGPKKIEEVQAKMRKAFRLVQNDPEGAIKAWEEFEAAAPKVAEGMADTKFQLLMAAKQFDKAYAAAGPIVDKAIAAKDAMKLNSIAWGIVDPEGNVEKKDLDLAMRAAVKADEFTEHKNAAIIDTLARVYWLKGEKAKAIELQTKAVSLAEDDMKDQLEETLEEYKKAAGKN